MGDWSDDDTPTATSSAPSRGQGSGGGGGGSGCRNCGEDGHFARDCPTKKSGGGDGCRKCGESGHMARDCELPDKCNKCNEEGHMARDCSKPDTCRKCGGEGHMARECPEPDKCRRCGNEGHMQADCTEEEKTRTVVTKDGETKEIYVPVYLDDEDLFKKETTISTGINFSKYDDIPVETDGENVPRPIVSFEESGLRQLLKDNILKSKYTEPTPIQKHTIPIVLAQRDLLACAQTGSGKTGAFLIPVIHHLLETGAESNAGAYCQTPHALVVTPTRELAIQIYDQSRKFASGSMIRSCIVYGGTSTGNQLQHLSKGCHILIATPGRLNDFVEKGRISFENMKFLILDEADRMLDMGFGPDIARIVNHGTMTKEDRTTLLFSATFPEDVRRSARQYLKKDKIFVTVGMVGAPCSDVVQVFLCLDKMEKKNTLLEMLKAEDRDPQERIMIFVNTKRLADFLAAMLSGMKFPATSIHGDRLQREREEALNDFRTGKRPIIVCTAVAARGLDIPNVNHVVNYDMPKDVDEYVHRVGRTGRVGNLGKATSFFDPMFDIELQGPLVAVLQRSGVELPDFLTGGGGGGGHSGGASRIPVGMSAQAGGGGGGDDDDW